MWNLFNCIPEVYDTVAMAGMDSEVVNIAMQLAAAVEMMMNPTIPQAQRHQAFQQLEQFKVT